MKAACIKFCLFICPRQDIKMYPSVVRLNNQKFLGTPGPYQVFWVIFLRSINNELSDYVNTPTLTKKRSLALNEYTFG